MKSKSKIKKMLIGESNLGPPHKKKNLHSKEIKMKHLPQLFTAPKKRAFTTINVHTET